MLEIEHSLWYTRRQSSALLRNLTRRPELDVIDDISQYRKVLKFQPPGHRGRAHALEILGDALRVQFTSSRNNAHIEEAIDLYREALTLRPEGDPLRPTGLDCLGVALRVRSAALGPRIDDLDEAVSLHREALQLRTGDSTRFSTDALTARHLAIGLCADELSPPYLSSQEISDIDQAIALCRENLSLLPHTHPTRPARLDSLGVALRLKSNALGGLADHIDEAIDLHLKALQLHPEAPLAHLTVALNARPSRPSNTATALEALGDKLFISFNSSQNVDLIAKAIDLYRTALVLRPHEDNARPRRLDRLGIALRLCSDAQGGLVDYIDEAIHRHLEALEMQPDASPMNLTHLTNALKSRPKKTASSLEFFGDSLHALFGRSYSNDCINLAIGLYREALALRHADDITRPARLDCLGIALRYKSDALGGLKGHIAEAVFLHRKGEALRVRHATTAHHKTSLATRHSAFGFIADKLRLRFLFSHEFSDIDRAVALYREDLALLPRNHPAFPIRLHFLGIALRLRHDAVGGRTDDLDEVIQCHLDAFELRSGASFAHLTDALNAKPWNTRAHSFEFVADRLYAFFKTSHSMDYIDQAIDLYREALVLRLQEGSNEARPAILDRLGIALCHKSDAHERWVDGLDEAISLHLESLRLRPNAPTVHLQKALAARYSVEHPNLTGRANADELLSQFRSSGKISDIDQSISLYREELVVLSPNDCLYPQRLDCLGIALVLRIKISGGLESHVDEAIGLHQEALRIRPENAKVHLNSALLAKSNFSLIVKEHGDSDEETRAFSLENQARTHYHRFFEDRLAKSLELSISLYRQALDLRREGNPHRSQTLQDLALALKQCLSDVHTSHLPLEEIFNLLEEACVDEAAPAETRLLGAQEWTHLAQNYHHRTLVRAYTLLLTLLDRGLILNPTLELQQDYIGRYVASYGLDAAASAIAKGDSALAVELLERGRTLLWSMMRGYRQPLDVLYAVDEPLARKLEETCKELEAFATSSNVTQTSSRSRSDAKWDRQRELSGKYHSLVATVHKQYGPSGFLRETPYSHLRMAAAEGPIIVVNISQLRSDALVITHLETSPVVIPLADEVSAEGFLEMITRLGSELGDATVYARADETRSSRVQSVLTELWNLVVGPVMDHLRDLGIARMSRIWWCPTGILCALPLHAARSFESHNGSLGCSDLYVSSYTPTIGSLIAARANLSPLPSIPGIIAVGQLDASLPTVLDEIQVVKELGSSVDELIGEEASPDTVLFGLQSHTWAHLACHGHLDRNIFHSSFKLHNHSSLRIVDIIRARMPDAEFAFLSACHSAAIGNQTNTPDEVVHLAAAMQFCGFRSVVGTLWAMSDADAPNMAREFYGYMFRHGDPSKVDYREAAMALRVATKALRKAKVPVDRWINFIHIGA